MGTGKTVRRIFALAAVAIGVWVGPASAQSAYVGIQSPGVGATDPGRTGAAASDSGRLAVQAVASVQGTQGGGSGRLALTGIDVMSLVAIGGGAIAVGAVLKQRADA